MAGPTVVAVDQPTAVYRFYDSDERLLYVGITCHLADRFRAHEITAPWWSEHRSARVVWHDTRVTAADEEREAICSESPMYNVKGAARLPRSRARRVRPDADTMSAIAMEVGVAMTRARLSKREMREALGLSRQSAWQRMTGQIAFSDEELYALADRLGISVSVFTSTLAVA